MQKKITELRDRLTNLDYKFTPQRRAVLEVLLKNPDGHLSADEIYELVKENYPEMGIATVYRTLDLLVKLDILQKLNFGDGCSRFEFSQSEHHHHHLICLKCGKFIEVRGDLLEKLEEMITRENQFEIINHELKFYGYCSDCRNKNKDKE
ncbi:MAG TPA: transcriptional repressor [Clostridia bacterium]|jgi:Fur family ferric uptake transcriptional regulator|nr:transcriptional repressor [Clostridia bacterium]